MIGSGILLMASALQLQLTDLWRIVILNWANISNQLASYTVNTIYVYMLFMYPDKLS